MLQLVHTRKGVPGPGSHIIRRRHCAAARRPLRFGPGSLPGVADFYLRRPRCCDAVCEVAGSAKVHVHRFIAIEWLASFHTGILADTGTEQFHFSSCDAARQQVVLFSTLISRLRKHTAVSVTRLPRSPQSLAGSGKHTVHVSRFCRWRVLRSWLPRSRRQRLCCNTLPSASSPCASCTRTRCLSAAPYPTDEAHVPWPPQLYALILAYVRCIWVWQPIGRR